MKTYSELIGLPTIEERFLYLQEGIAHSVGDQTFGSLRYTNQALYRSRFWKEEVRPAIIARDNGCDIAMPGFIIPHLSHQNLLMMRTQWLMTQRISYACTRTRINY